MINLPSWDQSLINKYNISGPRYTSYPTALSLADGYNQQDMINAIAASKSRSLSLYIHIPFCSQLCYYCGCNKVITRHQSKADLYLDNLALEIAEQATLFADYKVEQLHLGGGTPTFLSAEQMSRLMVLVEQHFNFADDAERGIEIDPRSLADGMLVHLRKLGFNRVSFGIQDFNDDVQLAVNRPQSVQSVKGLISEARELGFKSINADMIYGLPLQTPESFKETIAQLIELNPDRVSVFNYAHLPDRFAAQRKIKDADLPSAGDKLTMFKNTLEQMLAAGYQFIGMDHFALPEDELAVAQREGILHRNFQGYTTQGECDLIGFGVSAISMVGDAYAQNQKELKKYYAQVNELRHALWKGVALDNDDLLRREVIKQLICNFKLDKTQIESEFSVNFNRYFKEDLELLQTFINDELVEVDDKEIRVTLRGRLLIRNICMCFDKYLRAKARQQQFSRVI